MPTVLIDADGCPVVNLTGRRSAARRAGGHPPNIANMVLFLCSDKAGFITGENICIDGGMTRQMICHNDFSWTYEGGSNA